MKMDNSFKAIFASMMIVSGLAACDKPGPAETAGKKIDQSTENVSNAVSNTLDKADNAITKKSIAAGQAIDDTEITAMIKSNLMNEPGLKSLKINVTTLNGVVTLSGSSNSSANREKAIQIAKAVDGVKSVKNKIVISQ